MTTINIIDKQNFFIVGIGQAYLGANNTLTPLVAQAIHYPNYNAASYAADLWLETTH